MPTNNNAEQPAFSVQAAPSNDDALIAVLETALQTHGKGSDASHDIHHARRVRQNALAIAELEGEGNRVVLTAAAYLHDLVNLPKNAPNRDQASRLSAVAAAPILVKAEFSDGDIKAIQHAIEAHSFSANIVPVTIEARILQDADRLEALGALGIARTFHVAGDLGGGLFDGEDPFAQGRELDDRTFAVDHFATKLLGLADTMQTASGRSIAKDRTGFLLQFLNTLAIELDQPMPW